MILSRIRQNRKLIVLVILLSFSIFFVIYHTRHPELSNASDKVFLRLFSPIFRTIASVENRVSGVFEWGMSINSIREKHKELSEENRMLKVALREISEENRKLRQQLRVVEQTRLPQFQYVAAEVIAVSPSPWRKYFTIGKGTRDGVVKGLSVINEDGLVGIVRQAGGSTSLVQLLIDGKFSVSAIAKDSGVYCVAQGMGKRDMLKLHCEHQNIALELGEEVITSGLDNSLFPKGILIGTISEKKKNKYGVFEYTFSPAVDFASVEFVLAVVGNREIAPPQNVRENSD